MENHFCIGCTQEKPIDQFGKRGANGILDICKSCANINRNISLYKWRKTNQKKVNECARRRYHESFKHDDLRKFILRCRMRLKIAIRCAKGNRNFKLENWEFKDVLGCNGIELRIHIELQFTEGMSWDKFSKNGIEIDHKIPLSKAKTKEDVLALFHYTNLQPLWHWDNKRKHTKTTVNNILN